MWCLALLLIYIWLMVRVKVFDTKIVYKLLTVHGTNIRAAAISGMIKMLSMKTKKIQHAKGHRGSNAASG